jgi:N-acetyl-anhydromuramyl-L-alanine amidase AmpD
MPDSTEWNSLVPVANRLQSPNSNSRKPASLVPTHIVVHVTGTDDLASVRKTFMAADSVSAHYLVTKDGQLIQFVPDRYRAWHAGIETTARNLYRKGAAQWRRYLKYFTWYKAYPAGSVYVDGDLKPVWDKTEAVFVARADGQPWPEYDYFATRWPGQDLPINFDVDADPNNYAIGIETLGFGATTPDPAIYTAAMYATLRRLVTDLSQKYGIPMKKGRVVGHEDLNPLARFGWDPAAGFEWSRVYD